MNELVIECVYCNSRREFNKFVRNNSEGSVKVIDHVSIKNKLIKADPYGEEPSDSIIGLNIINEITRCLRTDLKKVDRVIYLFKTLDFEIASNFKELIEDKTQLPFKSTLYLIDIKKNIDPRINKLFEQVNIIQND